MEPSIYWIIGIFLIVSSSCVLSDPIQPNRLFPETPKTPTEDSEPEISLEGSNTVENESVNDSGATLSITLSNGLSSESFADLETAEDKEIDSNELKPKPTLALMGRLESLMQRLLRFMGLSAAFKSGETSGLRRGKAFEIENNLIDPPINYREELRTTVGAVLGKADCLKQVACRAGKYIKGFKGKEIILVLLEKLSPEKWVETIEVVKTSAIRKDLCQYKCFNND